jgi:EmrB/QacA subfamily drug resistance transporter
MSAVAVPGSARGRSGPSVRLVFSGLLLVMLVAALDSTIVSTALPTIAGDLGGLQHISWVATAYLLGQTVVTPLYGKIGDLFGRKRVLQGALVLFLIGSALCGAAQSMTALIAFRAIQGLGGGGLMVLSQAAIGDVVPPAERGRYSGFFGAIFGVATVIGPLLGGFLTTNLSWRWIFYVNLPVGIVAIAVLAVTLPSGTRSKRSIDYAGTALLGGSLTALILATSLGGNAYDWGSGFIIGMGIAAVALLAAFVFVERRTSEPVLPPSLFRNNVIVTTGAVGLIVGFALLGSVTYLPTFLQVVNGVSPTASGLQLLPLMGGLLVMSIITGQIVTRTGRYKAFPIIGTAVMALGLYLLSTMDEHTSRSSQILFMLVLGIGLGLVMQVLVLAAQNTVSYEQLGVATSSATLFRLIGSALGTAVLGAVFSNRLASELSSVLPKGGQSGGSGLGSLSPSRLDRLPIGIRGEYVHAFAQALDTVFLVGAGISVVAFGISWLIKEEPLRQTVTTTGVNEGLATPTDRDSLTEITRALGVLLGRDGVKRAIERTVEEAGLELSARAAFVMFVLGRDPEADLAEVARMRSVDPAILADGLAELQARSLVQTEPRALTQSGHEALELLLAARRRRIAALLDGWSPEQYDQVGLLLSRLAREAQAPAPA